MWYTFNVNRKFEFSPGEYYHVYNRGVDKRQIYMDKLDYERFCKLLYIANSIEPFEIAELEEQDFYSITRKGQLVDICAYCLMPNHFHMVLRESRKNGISTFMMMINVKRIIKAGFMNFKRGGTVSWAAVLVTTITLSVITALVLLQVVLNFSLNQIKEKVDVTIYFNVGAREEQIMSLKSSLEQLPEVAEISYTSAEEALKLSGANSSGVTSVSGAPFSPSTSVLKTGGSGEVGGGDNGTEYSLVSLSSIV